MGLLFVPVLVTLFLTAPTNCDEPNHKLKPFNEIKEILSNTTATLPEHAISKLINLTLQRFGNESETTSCDCFLNNPLALLGSSDANETIFQRLSVIIVVFMRDPLDRCNQSCDIISGPNATYDYFVDEFVETDHNHGADDSHSEETTDHVIKMSVSDIEGLLADLKVKYRHGSGNDNGIPTLPLANTTIECYSAESLLDSMSLSHDVELDKESQLEELASYIVYYTFKGHCISTSGDMHPWNFNAYLFAKYGSGNIITKIGLEHMMEDLHIGNVSEDKDDHSGHDHRKKRHIAENMLGRYRRSTADEHSHSPKCHTSQDLLTSYFNADTTNVSTDGLKSLCPAFLEQILSKACNTSEKETAGIPSAAQAYGYGTVAVVIMTFCTVLGAIFFKLASNIRIYILNALMAIGVGTLCGDAFLHLIPVALGLHSHAAHRSLKIADGVKVNQNTWYMFVLVMTLYALFVVDVLVEVFWRSKRSHSHDIAPTEYKADDQKDVTSSDVQKETQQSLALMVILGDGLHNVADGLAIGAAFADSIGGGIATSLAIFFHELPHELGDFALLIAAGLSIKWAVLMNLLSGCTAFIGLYVGVAITRAETQSDAKPWIFTLAAGVFIYVSIATVIPQLKLYLKSAHSPSTLCVVQNIGILFGITVMLLISIFEEYLNITVD